MPTTNGYDPKKAALYNKLRQSGLSEDAAFAQSGIGDADAGNYALGSNGQLGATVAGGGKVAGVDFDRPTAAETAESARFDRGLQSSSNFEQVDYAEKSNAPPSKVTPINYTTTSTETVSGGGSTSIVAGPRQPTASSQAVQPAINAKQAEIDQFVKDNPSDFARKKQGLPPLSLEEKQQRQQQLDKLTAERGALKNQQTDAETPGNPTVTTTPNTTTTTQTVTTGTTSTDQQVNPESDQKLSQQNEAQLDATPSLANASTARDAAPVTENVVASGTPNLVTSPDAAPVAPSQNNDQNDFVRDPNTNELVPSDSAQAQQIRAEQNRVEAEAAAPQREFVYDPETNEMVASDSDQAQAIREEESREENRARFDNAPPGQEFVYNEATGEMVPGDSAQADEIRASAMQPEPVQPNLTQAWDPETGSYGVWDEDKGQFVETGLTEEDATRAAGDPFEAERLAREAELNDENPPDLVTEPEPVPQTTVDEFGRIVPVDATTAPGLTPEEQAAKEQAAAKANAINQATLNSVYKKEGSSDWRLRLQLAPTSNYLYNAKPPGILGPLAETNGVIFPYTPAINTSYRANYEQYDLVHSNYRGVYYKNSRVDDLQIRGKFTAQDTSEANYLLAVIHFFRSVTKMFYGKDAQRGTPPPLVFLSGFGMNQFYGHPCVVSSFQYNLPDNVDYIRATTVNDYGTDLLNRRNASAPSSVAGLGATGNRILNAGLEKFFPASKPAPNTVVANVNNTQLANYVPTMMEIDITLIPVQTRSQVSKQFSLQGFANGDLIKGGFW